MYFRCHPTACVVKEKHSRSNWVRPLQQTFFFIYLILTSLYTRRLLKTTLQGDLPDLKLLPQSCLSNGVMVLLINFHMNRFWTADCRAKNIIRSHGCILWQGIFEALVQTHEIQWCEENVKFNHICFGKHLRISSSFPSPLVSQKIHDYVPLDDVSKDASFHT